jgi:hypothetical protein
MKKLINLLLLFVMSFSIAHGVVFDEHEDSHCSVKEYVAEFSVPIYHDETHHDKSDICDTHFMFHVSFLLPSNFSLFELNQSNFRASFQDLYAPFSYINNSFRPPIV